MDSISLISKQIDSYDHREKIDHLFFNPVLLLGHEILTMTQEYFPEGCVYVMSAPICWAF